MRLFYNIFILLLFNTVYAQKINVDKEIDSINKIEDVNNAIKYTDSILQYDFKNKYKIELLNANNLLKTHSYNKASTIFEKYINSNEGKLTSSLVDAHIGYGEASAMLGNINEATNTAFTSLKLSKLLNNDDLKGRSVSLISLIYYINKDYSTAIKYAQDAVKIHKKKNNVKYIAELYNNISAFYYHMNLLDSVQVYNLKALDLHKKIGDKFRVIYSYTNIGVNYFENKQYEKAKEYYLKAQKINEDINGKNATPYNNLADLYLSLEDYTNAKKYFLLALDLIKDTDDFKNIGEKYSYLLKISLKEKNLEEAIYYQRKRDSVLLLNVSKESKNQLVLLKTQHKLMKNEEALLQEIAINKKNKIIYFVVAIFLLMLGLYIFQKKNVIQLKLNQEKLILEQRVLRSQMNPHFIFNALTSIQKNLLENDLLKSSLFLSKFSKIIRQNFEFTSKELIGLDEDIDALRNYLDIQQLRFEDKFSYQIVIPKNIEISTIKIPPMLLQPFVENAIIHGLKLIEENGTLIVNLKKTPNSINSLLFEIIDNGAGYKEQTKKDEREHAIDVFTKRLQLRNLKEEDSFKIEAIDIGTKVSFTLNLGID